MKKAMTLNQPFPIAIRRSTLLIPSQPRIRNRVRRRTTPVDSARFLANTIQTSRAERLAYALISMLVAVAVMYAFLVTISPW